MADVTFNTKDNQTVARGLLILFLNVGEQASPKWAPVGKRVEDSSLEFDWQRETKTDILGSAYTTMKTPIMTQSFDPWDLMKGDEAQLKIWNKAIRDQDAQALCNMDMLLVHLYAGESQTKAFAERYSACAVEPTNLGGAGGGNIGMGTTVTFGGTRTIGTATIADGVPSFTPDTTAAT